VKTYIAWYEDRGTATTFRVLVDAESMPEARALLEADGMNVLKLRPRALVWAMRGTVVMVLLAMMGTVGLMYFNAKENSHRLRAAELTAPAKPLWERQAYFNPVYIPKPEETGNDTIRQVLEAESGKTAEQRQTEERKQTGQAVNLLDVLGGG
jgi:hypothetical protein